MCNITIGEVLIAYTSIYLDKKYKHTLDKNACSKNFKIYKKNVILEIFITLSIYVLFLF